MWPGTIPERQCRLLRRRLWQLPAHALVSTRPLHGPSKCITTHSKTNDAVSFNRKTEQMLRSYDRSHFSRCRLQQQAGRQLAAAAHIPPPGAVRGTPAQKTTRRTTTRVGDPERVQARRSKPKLQPHRPPRHTLERFTLCPPTKHPRDRAQKASYR